jgi:hypothetical protein
MEVSALQDVSVKSTRSGRRRKARMALRTEFACSHYLAEKTTKLNTSAAPFTPSSTCGFDSGFHEQKDRLPPEVSGVLRSVAQTLSSNVEVQRVIMTHDSKGLSVTMHVELSQSVAAVAKNRHAAAHSLKALAKQALHEATAQSTSTYLIGYFDTPFIDAGDCSFSASLASVLPSNEAKTCWHYYQRGFCPCLESCIFQHPTEEDQTRVWITCSK